MRRIFRLFPPFYIVLALNIILVSVGLLDGVVDSFNVMLQALHLSNYMEGITRSTTVLLDGTRVLWSLAVEEHFYLLFPFSFLFLLRRYTRRQIACALIGLCALIIAWRFYLVFVSDIGNMYIRIATDTRLDSIVYGCILALVANPALDPPGVQSTAAKVALLCGGLLILVVCAVITADPDATEFRYSIMYTLQGVALFPLIIYGIRHPEWWCYRWLNWRWMAGLGTISYTFYLIHPAVLKVFRNTTDLEGYTLALPALGVVIALSIAMYRVVEAPMARQRKRLRVIELDRQTPIQPSAAANRSAGFAQR